MPNNNLANELYIKIKIVARPHATIFCSLTSRHAITICYAYLSLVNYTLFSLVGNTQSAIAIFLGSSYGE